MTPRSLACMEVPLTKREKRKRKCVWRQCGEDLEFGWGPIGFEMSESSERQGRAGRWVWSSEGKSRLAQEHLGGRLSLFFPLQIPVPVLEISSAQHPVKAGLSDAFMILNPSPDVPGESPGIRRDPWMGLDSARIEPGWQGQWQWQGVEGWWRVEWELREEKGQNEFQLFFIQAEEPFFPIKSPGGGTALVEEGEGSQGPSTQHTLYLENLQRHQIRVYESSQNTTIIASPPPDDRRSIPGGFRRQEN